MTPLVKPIFRAFAAPLTTILIALGTLAALSPGVASAAKDHTCPRHTGQIAKTPIASVWHKGFALYGCSTEFDHRPTAKRMGPWDPRSIVVMDGGTQVAWTMPQTIYGVRSDRVFAGDTDSGKRWLSGTRLIPQGAGQPFKEARIARLIAVDQSAAWITTTGDVVLALNQPNGPATAVGSPPAPLVPVKQLLLVGSFQTVNLFSLTASATLTEGDGDGDECGGANPYTLSVTPAGMATLGATWNGYWTSTEKGC
jgi:hypothetical protein